MTEFYKNGKRSSEEREQAIKKGDTEFVRDRESQTGREGGKEKEKRGK